MVGASCFGKAVAMGTTTGASGIRTVPDGLRVAAVLGVVHALFSLYWAVGGTFLVWSLGTGLRDSFSGREWLLVPVGAVKLAAALAPVLLARSGWPAPRLTRALCWLGALVLVLWGGLNTVVGNAVLAGLVTPDGGYDRPGMIGHAWLWDPLFLAWGISLAVGLLTSRSSRAPGDAAHSPGEQTEHEGGE